MAEMTAAEVACFFRASAAGLRSYARVCFAEGAPHSLNETIEWHEAAAARVEELAAEVERLRPAAGGDGGR